jgi:hypothetical protein
MYQGQVADHFRLSDDWESLDKRLLTQSARRGDWGELQQPDTQLAR